jgi:hypothetical protein
MRYKLLGIIFAFISVNELALYKINLSRAYIDSDKIEYIKQYESYCLIRMTNGLDHKSKHNCIEVINILGTHG